VDKIIVITIDNNKIEVIRKYQREQNWFEASSKEEELNKLSNDELDKIK
jgi:hypothetical protein